MLGLVRFGQVMLGQVKFGQVWLGQVRLGKVRPECIYNPVMVKGCKRDFTKFFGLTVENIQKIFYIVMGCIVMGCIVMG